MDPLNEMLDSPEMALHLTEVYAAAKALYGFLGGDHPELGRALGATLKLIRELEKRNVEIVPEQ